MGILTDTWMLAAGALAGASPSIVSKIRNRDARKADRISNIERIIDIQTKKIDSQAKRIDRLEERNERQGRFIRKAITCKVPNVECPVLLEQQKYDIECEKDCRP